MLDCAYHAGHTYADIGDSTRALSHLRFYVENVGPDGFADPEQVLESRFVIAQLLGSEDRLDEALAELEALRPAFDAVSELTRRVRRSRTDRPG